MKKNNTWGFTLIELLIVIGIIGFIAAAILVAVDPVKRIQDARNSQRFSEVNGILNAILKNQVDNRALFAGSTLAPIITQTTEVQVIVDTDPGATDCDSSGTKPVCGSLSNSGSGRACAANLSGLVPTYLAEVPQDPGATPATGPAIGSANSGYYIKRTAGNRIEIGACFAEQSATITVKR